MSPKTGEFHFSELVEIRGRLQDLLKCVSNGDTGSYREIALTLQKMFCPKGDAPLLKRVEDAFGFDILTAIHYSPQEEVDLGLIPAALAGDTTNKRVNNVSTWFRCGHELINILDAAERDEVVMGGRSYSYKQVIDITLQMGAKSEADLNLGSPLLDALPIVQRTLFDLARTSIQLVDIMEKRVKNGKYYPYFRTRKKA
jgi:hypothetical protein